MKTSRARISKKTPAAFGKAGRPAKDPVEERLRIYRAAGPLILEFGVRGTTIDAVARRACLSPGGIYHYFASKRDLLLYGLMPEALSAACLAATEGLHAALASRPPPAIAEVIDLYVEKNVEMIEFVRPSLHAAIELGRPELRRRLSAGVREDADSLVTALRSLHPDLARRSDLANAIRRTILGIALDETIPAVEARQQLRWVFRQLLTSTVGAGWGGRS